MLKIHIDVKIDLCITQVLSTKKRVYGLSCLVPGFLEASEYGRVSLIDMLR